ncbi:MAG: glycosyltransferase 87 family protein [Vicinamibacteria bacterium]
MGGRPSDGRAEAGGHDVVPAASVPLRALVVLLACGQLALSVWPALGAIRNDFPIYYVAARAVLDGRDTDRIYERTFWERESARVGLPTVGTFQPFPPANALVVLPVAWLPPVAAKLVWSSLLMAALAASLLVLARVLRGTSPWLLALALLVQTASVRNAIAFGQPYPLLLLLLALALLAWTRGRDLAAGLLIAPVVAVKLYGAPFVPAATLVRRRGVLRGAVLGIAVLTGLSLWALGPRVHATYFREMLVPSLEGRVLDPYHPAWGSPQSLARRLFRHEPDFNPRPAMDAPRLAAASGRGGAVGIVVAAVAAAVLLFRRGQDGRAWAAVVLGGLAASPMPSTYHLVLLTLPAAVLLAHEKRPATRVAVLALTAYAASTLPHVLAFRAYGWGSLAGGTRLYALIALLAIVVRPAGFRLPLAWGAAGAVLVGGIAAARYEVDAPAQRVAEARGVLAAEPVGCDGGLAWRVIDGDRFAVRRPDGSVVPGGAPRCIDGRLTAESTAIAAWLGPPAAEAWDASDADRSADGTVVLVDRAGEHLFEIGATGVRRLLVAGRLRRPRLSPDGDRVAFQALIAGSWDVCAVDRRSGLFTRVTRGPSNDGEPAWTADGRSIVFASDRGRGLGLTTLFEVPFGP